MNTTYRRYTLSLACVLATISVGWSAPAHPQSGVAEGMQRAGELMRQRDWTAAAAAYRDALRVEPRAPWTWYMLGTALHAAADFEGAIDAWEESIETGISLPGVSRYNLACSSARLGRSAEALDHLEEAAASAFYTSEQFREDPDLESSARRAALHRDRKGGRPRQPPVPPEAGVRAVRLLARQLGRQDPRRVLGRIQRHREVRRRLRPRADLDGDLRPDGTELHLLRPRDEGVDADVGRPARRAGDAARGTRGRRPWCSKASRPVRRVPRSSRARAGFRARRRNDSPA